LAAHQHKTAERNSDFRQIVNGLHFGDDKMDIHTQFHHVFWMGDLNYRVASTEQGDSKTPPDDHFNAMVNKITEGKLQPLFDGEKPDTGDQLTMERKSGRAFYGYSEGVPWRFRPTFKVERGQVRPTYDKKRSPAWCDRVLWKSLPGYEVKQLSYNSAESVTTGDHKPVYSVFEFLTHNLATAVDDSLGRPELVISRLRAHGIPAGDIGGKSDAYLTIHSSIIPKPVKTSTKSSTLTPDWGDELAASGKTIPLMSNNKKRLARCWISFKLYDADPTKDKLLAYATVPLAAAATGTPYEFRVDFTKGGVGAGVLQGNIQINWASTTPASPTAAKR